jgi:hypothetical protein
MRILRLLILLALVSFVQTQGHAQTAAAVQAELVKIYGAYNTTTLMKLTIYSSLAVSDNPGVKVDSTVGAYFLQGQNVLGNVSDGTTYLQNNRWSVLLLSDLRQMYVDSARRGQFNPKASPLGLADPALFDSIAKYEMFDKDTATKVIRLVMKPGSMITDGKIFYNKGTHLLTFAQYKMPFTEELYDSTGTPYISVSTSKYYLLTMRFSETWPDDPSEEIFNERQYFRKEGDLFLPAPAYSDYTVINSSGE